MEIEKDLAKLCAALNLAEVKYVVVGGCAIVMHGYYRTTHDIDLLVDSSPENIRKLRQALREIFDSDEALEIREDDVSRYTVVRFAPESEEIVIDLIGSIGDISFGIADRDKEEMEIEGVKIPVGGISTLIETKKGIRPKDKEDLLFLLGKKDYLERQG